MLHPYTDGVSSFPASSSASSPLFSRISSLQPVSMPFPLALLPGELQLGPLLSLAQPGRGWDQWGGQPGGWGASHGRHYGGLSWGRGCGPQGRDGIAVTPGKHHEEDVPVDWVRKDLRLGKEE